MTSDSIDADSRKIYNAALVYLRKDAEKSVAVNVRMCEYQDGEYQQPHQPLEGSSLASLKDGSQDDGESEKSIQPIHLKRYPIHVGTDIETLTQFQATAEQKDNIALQIAAKILPLTSAGLVLPEDRRFHHLEFTVRIVLPQEERIQWWGLASWIRGLQSPRGERSPGRTNFCGNIDVRHGDWKKEQETVVKAIAAATLKDVAPPGIPTTARLVDSSQARIGAAAAAIEPSPED